MNLSIIIPCKKEALNIASCIRRVMAVCPAAEVLVIDSGLDETQEIVNQLKKEWDNLHYVLCKPDRGKGDAIRLGIERSTGFILLQIDADLQFWPEDIPQLIKPLLENKADMTLATRFSETSQLGLDSSPFVRSFGNKFFSLYCSLLYQQKISDALAGFKAWKREVTDSFTLSSFTFTYEIELFAKALQNKWRVCDVPVHYEQRSLGKSNVPLIKTGLRILRDAFKFRFLQS